MKIVFVNKITKKTCRVLEIYNTHKLTRVVVTFNNLHNKADWPLHSFLENHLSFTERQYGMYLLRGLNYD